MKSRRWGPVLVVSVLATGYVIQPGASEAANAANNAAQCALAMSSEATVMGTPGNDKIRGTSKSDVIYGVGGNDTIYGLGGADLICAGPGNDEIYPGRGGDTVDAGEGDNLVYDPKGATFVFSGEGSDHIYGGYFVDSGAGDDYIDSSTYPSAVQIYAGAGNDVLIGSDHVTGDEARAVDKLYGGLGDDHIMGGRSGEWIWPGGGSDVVHGGPQNGWRTIVYFEDAPAGVNVSLADHIATGDGDDLLYGVTGVVGTSFPDTIVGGDAGDVLRGCGNADSISGKGGSDFIQGDDLAASSDHCPGTRSNLDSARGGNGYDSCAAETVRSCEIREADPSPVSDPAGEQRKVTG